MLFCPSSFHKEEFPLRCSLGHLAYNWMRVESHAGYLIVANLDAVHPSQARVSSSSDLAELQSTKNALSELMDPIKFVSSHFAAGDSAAELARLSGNVFQIPFHFLKMMESGELSPARHPVNAQTISLAYRCILQRHVESPDVIARHQREHRRLADLIESLICGREWTWRSAELFVRAFPDKRKIWHPHIPKTAGSSFFSAAFESGASYFATNALIGASRLSQIAKAFRIEGNPLLVSGHFPIHQFESAIGPFDQIITFVRDPLERAKSMFQFSRDVADGSKDVHKSDASPLFSAGFVYDSFEKSFENGYFGSNLQCAFITPQATSAAALDACALKGVEIGTMEHVDDTIRELLHRADTIRVNISRNSTSDETLSPEMIERFRACNSEDEMLFRTVSSRPTRIRVGEWTNARMNSAARPKPASWLRKFKSLF